MYYMEFVIGMEEILKDLGASDGNAFGNRYLFEFVRGDDGPTFSELAKAISDKFNIDIMDIDEQNALSELHEMIDVNEKIAMQKYLEQNHLTFRKYIQGDPE